MTRTAAQTARIAQARKDATAAGTRITTRTLTAGLVRVTEHDGDTTVSMTLNSNGRYVGQATPAKAVKAVKAAAKKATKATTWTLNADIADRVAVTLFNGMSAELQAEFVATLTPEELATLEAGLKRGRELQARAAR